MKEIVIYSDGASSGNPGLSGVGIVIYKNGALLKKISHFIGKTTNNVAEYSAFIQALQEVRSLNPEKLELKTDSELLYKQLKGDYKVKHANIKPLFIQIKLMLSHFKQVDISHIGREDNALADKLAKEAIKKAKREQV